MERVKQNTPATISNVWYSDGVIADPGTVTVGVTRDDGTVLVAAGAATSGGGAAARTFNLTTTHTSLLDRLVVTWTSSTLGVDGQVVEVVGDYLFSVAQAKALTSLANKTSAEIIEKRTLVEVLLENACGVAFVPRYSRKSFNGTAGYHLLLPPRTTAIRSVKLDGTLVTDISTLRLLPTGELYFPSGWTRGFANYEVAFEHGYSDGAERFAASDAALTWARYLLVKGPIDERTTSMSTEDGTFSLLTPGRGGSVSGIPSVDAFIQSHNLSVAVA